MSWINQYLGGEYSETQNCFWWFRKVQHEQFKRDVLPCLARADQVKERRLWTTVDYPNAGDAVWMKNNEHTRHIGTWTGQGVLHAINGVGVVHDSLTQLKNAGWQILGFETK